MGVRSGFVLVAGLPEQQVLERLPAPAHSG
jgi:hypothetical protein